jgi:hypothetical protein
MAGERVPVTGGCLCGAVRFACTEPPLEGHFCHCRLCQKNYGALFSATLRFPGAAFRFTKGEQRYYRATSIARRGFCAACGSPVAFFYDDLPDVWIKIGSLDHPEDWPMTSGAAWGRSSHIHSADRIAWERIDDGLPQHAGVR